MATKFQVRHRMIRERFAHVCGSTSEGQLYDDFGFEVERFKRCRIGGIVVA